MSLSNEPTTTPEVEEKSSPDSVPSESGKSMQAFYQLSQELFSITLVLTGIIFISVWIFYSLNIALNYLIGSCTGVVYLKMLGKNVEQLGAENPQLSKNRFALLIGLLVVASQWDQLQILPVFLGFLTYKATLLVYTLRTIFNPDS
ncbi:ATP synthase subunit I [Synechocystis sp. PCC 7509]|uniref:ATP synthase subunit I n=1 Tax=Synechocystis sp. PCC 7509 TaxID=927677 RepID=UPI0003180332|nr:ATP synthase subunit I [Synechocystis sp. PCC 7509]